jgi:hypothetical protein
MSAPSPQSILLKENAREPQIKKPAAVQLQHV